MGIGRLAVEKEWRQHGFGRILVKEMERKAAVLGAKMVLLDAQIRAIGFMKSLAMPYVAKSIWMVMCLIS